jgi:uncharacterized protein
VDADRIAVWGFSMGGGHALLTAARDNRIAAVVAVMPSTDPLAAPPPLTVCPRMIGRALREAITRRAVTMPAAGPPGSFAVIAALEALPGFGQLTSGWDWRNEVNTSWLLTGRRWRPVREAANIRAPVLLQLGERDGAAPLAAIEQTATRAPRAELERYDLDHFECFHCEHIDQLASDQLAFLRRACRAPPPRQGSPKHQARPLAQRRAAPPAWRSTKPGSAGPFPRNPGKSVIAARCTSRNESESGTT